MAIEKSDFKELSELISTAVAKALKSNNSSSIQQKSSSPEANRLSDTKSPTYEIVKSMRNDMRAIELMVKNLKDIPGAERTIGSNDLNTYGLQSYTSLLDKSAEQVSEILKQYEAINMRHLSAAEQVMLKESALAEAREAAAKEEEGIIEQERRMALLNQEIANTSDETLKAKLQNELDTEEALLEAHKEEQAMRGQEIAARKKDIADKKAQARLEQKLREDIAKQGAAAFKKSAQKRRETEEEIFKLREEAADEELSQEERIAKAKEAAQKEAKLKMLDAFKKAVGDMVDTAIKSMKAGMESTATYAARANARLQGLDRDYDDMSWKVKGNLAINPFISLQKTYENLNSMIHSGIAYNVEYRAFLQTLSEKVAETFEANNETLLRIVRLQQADSTANRLALESTLTEFYNKMYEDSTYLQNTFDNVSSALLEASSVMSADDSVNFEYVVQKWLGSLYSLGMSGGAVESIAQGIGLLGSGNVTALTSNNALNSLFALAASKARMPYNELLTEGLTAKDTNDLLKAMVEYLAEIAHNEDNLVVRSAYGDIFNLTQSDFKALSNLRISDINNIYNAGDSVDWTQRLKQDTSFSTLFSRTTISEMTDTLVNNALYSLGESLGSNPVTQVIWKATDLLDTFAAGIPIPSISTLATGLDLEATVSNLMRVGLAGYGLVDTAVSVLSALGKGGDAGLASMERWGAASVTKRGTGFTTNPSIGRTNTSGSTVYNAASGSDIGASTVGAAEDDANKKIDEKQSKDYDSGERTITHLFELLTEDGHEGKNAYFNMMNPKSIYDEFETKLDDIISTLTQRSDEDALKVNITKIGSKKVSDTGILNVSVINNIESAIKSALTTYFGSNKFKSADGTKTYTISEMAKCIIQSFGDEDGNSMGHLRVAEVGTDKYAKAYGLKNQLLTEDLSTSVPQWIEYDVTF